MHNRFPNEGTTRKWSLRPVQGVIRIPHKVQDQERQIRLPLKEHGMQWVQMGRDLQIIPRLCLKIVQGPQGLFQFQCRQPHPHPQAQRTYYFPRQMLQTICLVKANSAFEWRPNSTYGMPYPYGIGVRGAGPINASTNNAT